MDAKIKSIFTLIAVVFILISIVTATIASFAYMTEFESPIGHFKFGAVYAPVFKILSAVCTLAAIGISLLLNSKISVSSPLPLSAPVTFTCAISGAMLVICSIISLTNIVGVPETSWMLIAKNIIGIPAGLCFLFCSLSDPKKTFGNVWIALLTFAPVIWAVMSLLFFYFDNSYALNSPVRTSMQLMYVSIMIFLPHDCRFILGRSKPGGYIFTGFCTIVFCGIVAFAGFFTSISSGGIFPLSLLECFLYLSLWSYALTRMLSLTRSIKIRV